MVSVITLTIYNGVIEERYIIF